MGSTSKTEMTDPSGARSVEAERYYDFVLQCTGAHLTAKENARAGVVRILITLSAGAVGLTASIFPTIAKSSIWLPLLPASWLLLILSLACGLIHTHLFHGFSVFTEALRSAKADIVEVASETDAPISAKKAVDSLIELQLQKLTSSPAGGGEGAYLGAAVCFVVGIILLTVFVTANLPWSAR